MPQQHKVTPREAVPFTSIKPSVSLPLSKRVFTSPKSRHYWKNICSAIRSMASNQSAVVAGNDPYAPGSDDQTNNLNPCVFWGLVVPLVLLVFVCIVKPLVQQAGFAYGVQRSASENGNDQKRAACVIGCVTTYPCCCCGAKSAYDAHNDGCRQGEQWTGRYVRGRSPTPVVPIAMRSEDNNQVGTTSEPLLTNEGSV
jgi:hypothetical protein